MRISVLGGHGSGVNTVAMVGAGARENLFRVVVGCEQSSIALRIAACFYEGVLIWLHGGHGAF